MINVVKDSLRFFINVVLIISLIFLSFLIVINLFHYKEMNYNKIVDVSGANEVFKGSVFNAKNKMGYLEVAGSCFEEIENSTFYKNDDKVLVNYQYVYNLNLELRTLSNTCLFKIKSDMGLSSRDIDETLSVIDTDTSFINELLLSNSSYSFSSDSFKDDIEGDLLNSYNLLINRYILLSSEINHIADTYAVGGNL